MPNWLSKENTNKNQQIFDILKPLSCLHEATLYECALALSQAIPIATYHTEYISYAWQSFFIYISFNVYSVLSLICHQHWVYVLIDVLFASVTGIQT